mgnify:CR=1 FL=1
MYFSGTGTTKKVTAAIADQLAKALAAENPPGKEILGEAAGSEKSPMGSPGDEHDPGEKKSGDLPQNMDLKLFKHQMRLPASRSPLRRKTGIERPTSISPRRKPGRNTTGSHRTT